MAYEFKKLSDVEVVEAPTDNANVLIEEDGIIKKAPKSVVSNKWDAIIDLGIDTEDSECAYWEGSYSSARFVSGDYDTIMQKLNNNEMPNILLYGTVEVYSVVYNFKVRASSVTTSNNEIIFTYNVYAFPYGGLASIACNENSIFVENSLWTP